MQYVYAALLLHKLNKEINEDSVKKVIKATGEAPDEVKVKALVSALSEVNIEEALKAPVVTAAPATAAAPAQAPAAEAKAAKKEKAKEEEAKKEEEALAGLSSLFG